MYILDFFKDVVLASISILNGASGWLIISFIIAGLLHNLISPEKFQKSLGNKKYHHYSKVQFQECYFLYVVVGLYL